MFGSMVNENSFYQLFTLSLIKCTISLEGAKSLARILRCCSALRSFTYSSRQRTRDDLGQVCDALKQCKQLHTLALPSMADGGLGGEVLADLPRQYTVLNKLDISYSRVEEDGAQALVSALKPCKLYSLDISSCGFGSSGAVALAQCLKSCVELHICVNRLRSSGARALADSLLHCTNLTTLDVSCNDIGDSGTESLVSALKHCTKLRDLDITHNKISDNGLNCT